MTAAEIANVLLMLACGFAVFAAFFAWVVYVNWRETAQDRRDQMNMRPNRVRRLGE
jgi:hypothetical protein